MIIGDISSLAGIRHIKNFGSCLVLAQLGRHSESSDWKQMGRRVDTETRNMLDYGDAIAARHTLNNLNHYRYVLGAQKLSWGKNP